MHYAICDYILDIVQNAIEAGSRETELTIHETDSSLVVTLADTGRGMDAIELSKAQDPFYTDGKKHPGRRVGLGLPFLIQLLSQTGGEWRMESSRTPAPGTTIWVRFNLDHIDTPPVGDLVGTLAQAMTFGDEYELTVHRCRVDSQKNECSYVLRRSELRDALGELFSVASIGLLRDFIASQEANELFC